MRQYFTKMPFNDPIFLVFSFLLLLHGVNLWQQSQPDRQATSRAVTQIAAVTYRGNTQGTAEAATRFSQAFGVAPVVAQTEQEVENKIETLADLNPKLIAVDEINQQLTARIVLSKEQNRLTHLRLDDELAGYKLTNLTLTKATFTLIATDGSASNTATLFTLEVFSQAEPEHTAGN